MERSPLTSSSATVDLPLPGNPVIQTHHPVSKAYSFSDATRENIVNLLISLQNKGYKQSTYKNLGFALNI